MILTFKEKDFSQGEGQRGPWTRYDYWWRERKEKTSIFDSEDNAEKIAFLEELAPGHKAEVTLEAKKSGKYINYTILDVRAVDGAPQTTAPLQQATPENLAAYQAASSEVPKEVWEAKDRATYMESAYKSACQAFQGKGDSKENRHDIIVFARWIYLEIMAAHDDKPLQKMEQS